MSSGGPPAVSQAKARRYDRQLRLWGDHGQTALGDAKVCCITAGALGSETLKNLVLPGVGAFTIIDHEKVVESDLGNNFFVTQESIGKSRAQVVCELLQEMNADVNGDWREESASTILKEDPTYFTSFSCVVATDLDEDTLLPLAALLWESKIPLLVGRAYGMIGSLRLVAEEHYVLEAHPDASKPELLKIIKEQYNGLTDAAKETFQTLADKDQTRYDDALEALEEKSESEEESESEEDEEEDDDDDGSEYEEEDDDEPPNKKKRAEPEEESSDEEPLEPGTFPTDKQITKCVRKIVRTADLEVMTKKTVRADAAKILGVNLDEKKALIKEVITETIDAMN